MRVLTSILGLLMPLGAALAQSPATLLEKKLERSIAAVERSISGILGVAVIDLTSGHVWERQARTALPTASMIKVPILARMFADAESGRLDWSEPVTLTKKDTVPGSGYLHRILRRRDYTLSWREMAEAMIEDSDNLATNQSIRKVGMERVNELLDGKGLGAIRLRRPMMDLAAARAGRENIATPLDMARLMKMIYDGSLVSAAASKEMVEILKRVDADMRRAIPEGVEVAAKPGDLEGVRCEAGIVLLKNRPFALAVMSAYLVEGENPVPAVTRAVYQYFEKLARSNEAGRRID